MWTYDVTHHMMVNSHAMIALASMTCVSGSCYYKLHHVDENFLINILIQKQILIVHAIRGQLSQDFYFVYLVEVLITLHWQA